MATGDVVFEAAHVAVYEDSLDRDTSGNATYNTTFRSGNSPATAVTPSNWEFLNGLVSVRRTVSGTTETLFDGAKRYTVTVTEE